MAKRALQTDEELIERARERDSKAYAELWRRYHRAGLKTARELAPGLDAEDLVSESFIKIMLQLEQGRGPVRTFRPYLYSVIKNTVADAYRASVQQVSVDDVEGTLLASVDTADPVHGFNLTATSSAYASLPEREQLVLWHTEVEGLPPRKVAPLLGITAAATAALAMRARRNLRSAWLAEHAKDPRLSRACKENVRRLADYHQGSLSESDRAEVDAHVAGCEICAELIREAERLYVRAPAPITVPAALQ